MPTADDIAAGVEFVLTQMGDGDYLAIAERFANEHQHTDDDQDYMIAACAFHALIVLRQTLKLIGEGKLVPAVQR